MPAATPDEVPNATPVALTMLGHGVWLAACGTLGAHNNDYAPKAMHSVYAGVGSFAVLATCAAMSVAGTKKLYMIGVHIGLLVQLVLIGVFSVQAFRSYGVPEKVADGRFALFCAMAAGSIGALGLMYVLKPKKKKA